MIAQSITGSEWTSAQSLGQLGLGGIVAWMLYAQKQDRESERKHQAKLETKVDCLARAILLQSMRANPSEVPSTTTVEEVQRILRDLKDSDDG